MAAAFAGEAAPARAREEQLLSHESSVGGLILFLDDAVGVETRGSTGKLAPARPPVSLGSATVPARAPQRRFGASRPASGPSVEASEADDACSPPCSEGSEADAASRVDGAAVAAIEGKLRTRYVRTRYVS